MLFRTATFLVALKSSIRNRFAMTDYIMQEEFRLDLFLSSKIDVIYEMFKERALMTYIRPYASIDLLKLMEQLCYSSDHTKELEMKLANLIMKRKINGRIDRHKKILYNNLPETNALNRVHEKIEELDFFYDLASSCHSLRRKALVLLKNERSNDPGMKPERRGDESVK
jgi:hypothetical protein